MNNKLQYWIELYRVKLFYKISFMYVKPFMLNTPIQIIN